MFRSLKTKPYGNKYVLFKCGKAGRDFFKIRGIEIFSNFFIIKEHEINAVYPPMPHQSRLTHPECLKEKDLNPEKIAWQ